MLLQLTHFLPFCPLSTQPTPQFHNQSHHCCPCPWVLHVCSLTSPFTSFQSVPTSPPLSYSCQSVPCFCASGSILPISLFCSLDSSYGSELIWSLSFTDWLISFSIIVPSSIHAVAKGTKTCSNNKTWGGGYSIFPFLMHFCIHTPF